MNTNRKSALIAGVALVLMAVAAAFSFGYIHNSLVIPTDPNATINNILSLVSLFKAEVFGWIIILICYVVVSFALYYFFKNENRKLSFYTAAVRLVYSAILGVAIFYLIRILNLQGTENTDNRILSHLESFTSFWSFGLIIFGIHLILLGFLTIQSKLMHKFWGFLLIFAGISYSVIHLSNHLFPELESQIKTAEMILSAPMALGEIGFAFWLIIRGGKPKIVFRNSAK